jgi:hypothetical protein
VKSTFKVSLQRNRRELERAASESIKPTFNNPFPSECQTRNIRERQPALSGRNRPRCRRWIASAWLTAQLLARRFENWVVMDHKIHICDRRLGLHESHKPLYIRGAYDERPCDSEKPAWIISYCCVTRDFLNAGSHLQIGFLLEKRPAIQCLRKSTVSN